MNSHVYLRNTVSGVVAEYDSKTAERYLTLYPHLLVRVNSSKTEVLSPPYVVDSEGERKRLAEPEIGVKPELEATSKKVAAKPEKKDS